MKGHAEPLPLAPDTQTVLYRFVAAVCRPAVAVLFRPSLRGLEHIPPGGFVFSANQLSNLDGFLLAYAIYPRQLQWMGKAELFHPLFEPALRRLGIFPVRRGEGDIGAVGTAVELAAKGHVVGIFPEGTRRKKGVHKKREAHPHTGAARVALAAEVPLVPAAIAGTDRLLLLRRWRLAVGKPVSVGGLQANRRLASREATQRLWEAITTLETDVQEERRQPSRTLRPRLRLDVSLRGLLFALASLFERRRSLEGRVLRAWAGADEGLVCLSVRSAFDLCLQVLEPKAGDEIAVSAVTHPDMIRVLEAHGLRPLPIDVDPETLAPRPDLLEQAITPRTRAVLIAHLFGSRVDLEALARVARQHGLLLLEDCAQSFSGPENAGDSFADISFFSFGPIKTATALGGALVRVRDSDYRARMRALQETWPVQPRREFSARVLKFLGLLFLGRPRNYWLFSRALEMVGRDLDTVVNGAVRGFPGSDLLTRIRRRPSAPLLALLEHRLVTFDESRLEARARLGEHVAGRLPSTLEHPGGKALDHTHWLFPIVTDDRASVIASLRRAGFDAAIATSSIAVVEPPHDRPDLAAEAARRTLDNVVFLPVYPELTEREVERLLAAVAEANGHAAQ